jgi:nucleotide sugar dehydrogenase
MDTKSITIGVIGQGYVGKNYADNLEDRGFAVVRYSLDPLHLANKSKIPKTDLVIIAVPTPTKNGAFDDSLVRDALSGLRKGQIVVIKSTVQKGTTDKLQREHEHLTIMHVPEFLRELYAREDVDFPSRNIIGLGADTPAHHEAAKLIEEIFPRAKHTMKVSAIDAEFIKYTHNTMGVMMIVYTNLLYDLAREHGVEWESVKDAILHNPWFPEKYLDPIHKDGRGAGGSCFIKDFAALVESYQARLPNDKEGIDLLQAIARKNNRLLRDTGKSITILNEVYGDE